MRSRVSKIEQTARGWRLTTRDTSLQSDFLIGADGATSLVRRTVGVGLTPAELCVTLGYFIPGSFPSHMKIYFVPAFEGYIWSFPRPNHTSYGLITSGEPGWASRAKTLLSNFIVADLGADVIAHAEFYSAPVPCLGPASWKKNRISGERWALVGDAAGLVDPITGEGIYYAFVCTDSGRDIDAPHQYGARVGMKLAELARASRVYKGSIGNIPGRFQEVFATRSQQNPENDSGNLIAGNQSYLSLKKTPCSRFRQLGRLITGR
jgi:hypothetical protein